MRDGTRSIFPGSKTDKPQYVLGTENGTKRTSNVTEEKIVDAVYDIEDHVSVYLEKCVPVVLVRYAEAYSIDYYKAAALRCVSESTDICCVCGGRTLIATWPLI